ncbi:type II toxin-antitoxin system RelE/ParE family toxin [Pleomorphomonas diazotrophica]|uniref:Type II toxin-antitoxin system RelE/ParE family toxin n=2 Tax=Pleomorphomonas diazotrophica TaxID=1166257 RepID=A0A2N3LSC2_9HYPH|nr:type II toxin-antitoxin system RelE/ParE family toxin [Pleomorphomonas diazotrophica]
MFGTHQLAAYAAIIEKGIGMVGEEPERVGSIDRSSIAPDVRLFHLELAAGRRGAAAHCLYCTTGRLANGEAGVIILRVLHEGMEPRGKLLRALGRPPT